MGRRFRTLTQRFRRLPDAIIIGAQKAASTSLFNYLVQHPRVRPPSKKEIGYFDSRVHLGEAWYRRHFPLAWPLPGDPYLTLEASTGYFDHPKTAERIARTLPSVKLIALVRNPIDRAWSHYQHSVRLGKETAPFEQALALEDERLADLVRRLEQGEYLYAGALNVHGYRRRGCYAELLSPWFAHFQDDRLLLVPTDDLQTKPAETMARVTAFLALPPHTYDLSAWHNRSDRAPATMAPATREELRRYYAPHNRALYELLGRDLGWE